MRQHERWEWLVGPAHAPGGRQGLDLGFAVRFVVVGIPPAGASGGDMFNVCLTPDVRIHVGDVRGFGVASFAQ